MCGTLALHPSQVGYLTSAYPLGMFFAPFRVAAPLSDKVGRKPILALSLLGVGCGLVAQARCVSDGGEPGTFLALAGVRRPPPARAPS